MLLTPDDIRNALADLGRRLTADGVEAGIRIVGGAAIALEYDTARDRTRDVDAFIHPVEDVMRHVREIARERGWPADWLNSDAQMFMTHYDRDEDWLEVFVEGAVTVRVGSAEMLLAMKLLAARGRRDGRDIVTLLTACDVRDLDHATEIFERYYPEEELKDRAVREVETWLGERKPTF